MTHEEMKDLIDSMDIRELTDLLHAISGTIVGKFAITSNAMLPEEYQQYDKKRMLISILKQKRDIDLITDNGTNTLNRNIIMRLLREIPRDVSDDEFCGLAIGVFASIVAGMTREISKITPVDGEPGESKGLMVIQGTLKLARIIRRKALK